MSSATCTVAGCARPLRARGYCATHWARWRKTGTTDPRPVSTACAIEGCPRPPRSKYATHCDTHYYRLRRTGTTADPERISGSCTVHRCHHAAERRDGLCRMHHLRIVRRGDVNLESRGEGASRWTGDDATYGAMHLRLRSTRGRASDHPCVDCGSPARHWSYNHADPDERIDGDLGLPYSTSIDQYDPRCVRCHKRFDLSR